MAPKQLGERLCSEGGEQRAKWQLGKRGYSWVVIFFFKQPTPINTGVPHGETHGDSVIKREKKAMYSWFPAKKDGFCLCQDKAYER